MLVYALGVDGTASQLRNGRPFSCPFRCRSQSRAAPAEPTPSSSNWRKPTRHRSASTRMRSATSPTTPAAAPRSSGDSATWTARRPGWPTSSASSTWLREPRKKDGRWHDIRVVVKDRRLAVRARRGYIASWRQNSGLSCPAVPPFLIALGLSLVGGFGGLLVASSVLLINDSTRSKVIPGSSATPWARCSASRCWRCCRPRWSNCLRPECSQRCYAESDFLRSRETRALASPPYSRLRSSRQRRRRSWATPFTTSLTAPSSGGGPYLDPLGISTAFAVAAHEIPQEVEISPFCCTRVFPNPCAAAERNLRGGQRRRCCRSVRGIRHGPEAASVLSCAGGRRLSARGDGRPDPWLHRGRTDAGSLRQILLIAAGVGTTLSAVAGATSFAPRTVGKTVNFLGFSLRFGLAASLPYRRDGSDAPVED